MDETTGAGAVQPAEHLIITTLEALKVFSDPLRQQIIEALLDGPKTVKQIASELDLVPTKLYYHINLLEEHRLIRVVETRIVSGIIEKRYSAAARNFSISRTLMSPGQHTGDQGLDAALASIIERTRSEIRKSVQQGVIDTTSQAPTNRKLLMGRGRTRMSKAHAEAFFTRLKALLEEFETTMRDDDDPDAQNYSFVFAYYPVSRKSDAVRSGDDPANAEEATQGS